MGKRFTLSSIINVFGNVRPDTVEIGWPLNLEKHPYPWHRSPTVRIYEECYCRELCGLFCGWYLSISRREEDTISSKTSIILISGEGKWGRVRNVLVEGS